MGLHGAKAGERERKGNQPEKVGWGEEGGMGSREVSLSRLEMKGLPMNHLNWRRSFPK